MVPGFDWLRQEFEEMPGKNWDPEEQNERFFQKKEAEQTKRRS